ncbi:hypothetical protein BBO99_00002492 [Phytophthora kernoviae]|uniref:FAM86 N-terminal domain-containing protein n=2 Tax=Phytophthora kernoviae TaxID=325452 RepID=A0A3R7HLJ0_9STRA|nr:hypothetical protein G195_004624 [Phytophthora kernoviae 00238/432]KAG2526740.1 hypothetical protein JM16_003710 [Phytophthora kernoviae]KAG2530698.1 hypothetical protein JM18_001966 [Phytophthora kernoviae]RLN27260.1 hypothetical protein BBI17_002416 [Phytophthora kernoviae]RLN82995.1 hypothetical protein BBO99_00002492 [Phytophthora kernoviae]
MVLICSTPPAPLPVDVTATRPLVQEIATSTAARAHVRVLASSTYGRCVLGLAGFLKAVTGHMAAFVECMDGEMAPEEVTILHELLLLLAETVVDEDNATFLAFVLARWIHIHRELFEGKSVIEVGSGLGLGGITAARYASQTTLTDYQSDTCTALEYNIKLNRLFTHEFDPAKLEVTVSLLDWDLTESIEAVPRAEVVIASDIICEPSTAEGFLRVVRHHILKTPGCVAYLMNANSHSRFGVVHLHALLAASTDLSYSITPVGELPDGAQLLETVSDAQELSYEFYEIRAASN